jgi:transcriptional regulator with XRE-family HTH domain
VRTNLTREMVREMFELRAAGWTQQALGDRFGVDRSAVSRALAGKRWSEVRAGIDVADTLTQHFLRTQIALRTLRAGARTTARLPPRTR